MSDTDPSTATDSNHQAQNPASNTSPLPDLTGQRILIKYGGNAMTDPALQAQLLEAVAQLYHAGAQLVVVHGGGPVIAELLERLGHQSAFVGGHRVTDAAAMDIVQMALKGRVNSELVRHLAASGIPAVGLSGKDARMVTARQRRPTGPDGHPIDLGQVGDVIAVDTKLLFTLLSQHFLPVVAPVSMGEDGTDYNVNADSFAGALAGALMVHQFLLLTDVDGLMVDINDPDSLLRSLSLDELDALPTGTITGGMIPKTEACVTALQQGAQACRILNGTKPRQLADSVRPGSDIGTRITLLDDQQ